MNNFSILLSEDPGVGRVQLCDEHCVHLTIGPVTLNLSPAAFAEAATLVRDAMDELSKLMQASAPDGEAMHASKKRSASVQ